MESPAAVDNPALSRQAENVGADGNHLTSSQSSAPAGRAVLAPLASSHKCLLLHTPDRLPRPHNASSISQQKKWNVTVAL